MDGTLYVPREPERQPVRAIPLLQLKRLVESWLRETALVVLEHWAESVQRRTIVRHTRPGRAGRVVISSHELAFHPDSKAEQVSAAF